MFKSQSANNKKVEVADEEDEHKIKTGRGRAGNNKPSAAGAKKSQRGRAKK